MTDETINDYAESQERFKRAHGTVKDKIEKCPGNQITFKFFKPHKKPLKRHYWISNGEQVLCRRCRSAPQDVGYYNYRPAHKRILKGG